MAAFTHPPVQILKETAKVARAVAVTLVRIVLCAIPRSSSVWVFGSSRGCKYGDNSMYFFRYCQRETNRCCIWLSRSDAIVRQLREEGLRAYQAHGIRGIYYGLRAQWHIVDVDSSDTSRVTSEGALLLNLWHGIPLKDIRRFSSGVRSGVGRGWIADFILHYRCAADRRYLVHPNRIQTPELVKAFHLRPENILLANLPRNVALEPGFKREEYLLGGTCRELDELGEALRPFGKVVGYFPTWRDEGQDLFLGMLAPEELRELNDFLQEHGIVLLTKWHRCSFAEYQQPGVSRTAQSIDSVLAQCSNIISLPFHTDLNSVLPQVDLLVTDYSSALFDFLLSDRPQLFYPYDLETYRQQWGFLFPYEQTMPGPIVRSGRELQAELKAFSEDPAGYGTRWQAARARLRDLVFETRESSARIVACMEEITSIR